MVFLPEFRPAPWGKAAFEINTMMVPRNGFSNGLNWLARTALVGLAAALLPGVGWGQFIRTPAESTAAERDWVPPPYYGFPLGTTNPTYYGGINSRTDYAYGRGSLYADMIGYRMPINKYLPDRWPWFTSYPYTGEIYVRSGPPLKRAPVPVPAPNPAEAVGRFQVEVPADATVFIEDKPTTLIGSSRTFLSPPLQPGKTYLYDIRARWQENGQEMEQKQTISLQAGGQVNVRFPMAEPLALPKGVVEDIDVKVP